MSCPIYQAKFISADPKWSPVCPNFKKTFNFTKKIKRATLYISALGIFEAFINGRRVGGDYMAPGWTNYKKRVQYFEYDVTALINGEGAENELLIGLGNGWFASRGGFTYSSGGLYNPFPALIASLELSFTDGSTENIISDESWQVAKSGVTFSGIYDGETFDARIVPDFCDTPRVFDYPMENLIPLEGVPTRECCELKAREVIVTPKGEVVLDFGQNITGVCEFVIRNAKGGETVSIDCAEILDKDGNFYNENYRTAKSRITYTTKEGWQVYKPHYTFFGFRYLRLNDWCEEVDKECFRAISLHSDMERTGYFKCGYEKINKLYSNVIWGQIDNFLDIPTDCPQRDERLGWTGDAQVFARTASLNFDTEKFFTKWLRCMASEQYADGGLPFVIPNALTDNEKNSAAWSDATCIIPWELYLAYGNKALLREHIPMMKKWIGHMLGTGDKRYLYLGDKHFGDWLSMDGPEGSNRGGTNEDLIANAYFYYDVTLLIKALDELGMKTEKYVKIAERIRSAFKKEYIKRGKLVSDTQTAHVVTIHFGLVDDAPELKERLGKRLVKLIEDNGDRLTTGFVGTPYLLDTLTSIGRADKAYTLLYQEAFPSWLFSVNMGATTIWEHWDGIREDGSLWSVSMNSYNHYAYGSVASWFYGTILGIKPREAGYKSFYLTPIASRKMGSAKARLETRCGVITSEWVYEGDFVRYSFTVPDGSTAYVKVAENDTEKLSGGTYIRYARAVD
ncbi:MAG: family 78 glycoside hydrolase catalytic domain [Clostridia bacterium]|nr:family 78 glycoside hydrolase catalytic domain [Clostridia bacterium]